MSTNKILNILLLISITTGLNSFTGPKFDNALKTAEQTAKKINTNFNSKNPSVENLRQLTKELVPQLKLIPVSLQQTKDTFIIQKESPTTSGAITWEQEISKQKFFNDINNIEKLNKQVTKPKQFQEIVQDINNFFITYFDTTIN